MSLYLALGRRASVSLHHFYHSIIVFVHLIFFLFLTFVSCLLTVTLHIVDVRLTLLLTYLLYRSTKNHRRRTFSRRPSVHKRLVTPLF